MKTTIFTFHPQLKNGSRINVTLANQARTSGFEIRDMYDLYPDFQIDVAAAQASLEATDRIVLQFPIYWYQAPALMKQWFDAVFEYGWAYGSTGKALQDKEILLVASFGAEQDDYTADGRLQATIKEILKPITTIQYLTDLTFLEPFVLTGTLNLADEELEKHAKDYISVLSQS